MRVFNDHPRCQYSRRTIRLVHLNCSTSTLITLKKTSSLNTFSFRVQWGLLNTTNNYVKPPNFIEKRQNIFQIKWINKTGKLGLFAEKMIWHFVYFLFAAGLNGRNLRDILLKFESWHPGLSPVQH